MDSLKISLAGVAETSGAIRSATNKLQYLIRLKQMNDRRWFGRAMVQKLFGSGSTSLRCSLKHRSRSSNPMRLDTAVSSYDTLETTIVNNARSFSVCASA
ncbi:MAG: WXG100 family type VII secretion target [Holdemania massiliensis]